VVVPSEGQHSKKEEEEKGEEEDSVVEGRSDCEKRARRLFFTYECAVLSPASCILLSDRQTD